MKNDGENDRTVCQERKHAGDDDDDKIGDDADSAVVAGEHGVDGETDDDVKKAE